MRAMPVLFALRLYVLSSLYLVCDAIELRSGYCVDVRMV